MNDDILIDILFQKVTKNQADLPEAVRSVFSMLVSTTLSYRDRKKEEENTVVTVEDVKITLEWFLAALQTGRLPKEENNSVRMGLLSHWFDALQKFGHSEAGLK